MKTALACLAFIGLAACSESLPTQTAPVAQNPKLLDELRAARAALSDARSRRDMAALRREDAHIRSLVPRIPRVTFTVPEDVGDLQVTVDGHPVSSPSSKERFAIDPGAHTLHAEGQRQGTPVRLDQQFVLAEGEQRMVALDFSEADAHSQ